jgi:serine/threonine protein kinase
MGACLLPYCLYKALERFDDDETREEYSGDWIALDAARGLLQLHQGQIVHLDFSQNVILGDNMTAKLSQYGLSCMLDPNMDAASIAAFGPSPYSPPETVRASLLVVLSWPMFLCILKMVQCASFQQVFYSFSLFQSKASQVVSAICAWGMACC